MPTFQGTYRIDRTPEQVFDVIGTHCYENHPRWEHEVVEIRPVTPGPIRLGAHAIMVRAEYGRRSETEYEVTAFEPGRRVAFHHGQGAMSFDLSFDLEAAGPSSTDLTVRVRMQPRGFLRMLSPLLALQLPRRSDRITRSMIALVEAQSAGPGRQAALVSA